MIFTARVRSTREGNVLTRVCPSIILSVHRGGGVSISHNALQHFPECHEVGGYPGQVPPLTGYPPRGVPGSGTPPGGVPRSGTPPWGGTRVRSPPGGYPGQVPPRPGTPPGGGTRVRYPPGGVPGSGTPPWGGYPGQVPPGGVPGSGTPPGGGTRVGQQKEYSLHGGRYASCVHAGGLSCYYLLTLSGSVSHMIDFFLSLKSMI